MSLRIDTSDLYNTGLTVGNTGFGVLAEDIPSLGESGGSFLYPCVSLPADNGKEVRAEFLMLPALGVFVAEEDGSFDFYNAPNGVHTATFRLWVDGVDIGVATLTMIVGAVDGIGTGILSSVSISLPVANASGTFSNINGGASGNIAAITIYTVDGVAVGTGTVANGSAQGAAAPINITPPAVVTSPPAAVGDIGNYILSNGMTIDQAFTTIVTMLNELSLINGLIQGKPVQVTPTSRTADSVSQSITEAGSTVTVTRL